MDGFASCIRVLSRLMRLLYSGSPTFQHTSNLINCMFYLSWLLLLWLIFPRVLTDIDPNVVNTQSIREFVYLTLTSHDNSFTMKFVFLFLLTVFLNGRQYMFSTNCCFDQFHQIVCVRYFFGIYTYSCS